MKSVTMTRRSAASNRPGNYRLDITITSANDITAHLFVKQRIVRGDGTIDDTFVTVASPSQIEDIPQSVPDQGDSYFRDRAISLVSSDPNYLQEICESIFSDVQLTLIQATDLDNLSTPETITISPEAVTIEQG